MGKLKVHSMAMLFPPPAVLIAIAMRGPVIWFPALMSRGRTRVFGSALMARSTICQGQPLWFMIHYGRSNGDSWRTTNEQREHNDKGDGNNNQKARTTETAVNMVSSLRLVLFVY